MARTLKNFDIVCVVEVVAGNGGAQAVARLVEALNRTGAKWDYSISDPTISTPGSSERYAFLWKPSKVKKVREAWLDTNFKMEIEREPYYATFLFNEKEFTVGTFHAIPKTKQAEREIKYFKFYPKLYSSSNLIFCGDFNCPQTHNVFNPLKSMGYEPALTGQKTTLKNECTSVTCLASEYDNIFYSPAKINCLNAGTIPFYKSFTDLKSARKISDHLPVFFEFDLKK